jgi:hypothetical protein
MPGVTDRSKLLELLCSDDRSRGGLLAPKLDDADADGSGALSGPGGFKGSTTDSTEALSLRGKAILVFLPGLGEIRNLLDRLYANRRFGQ